MTMVEAIAKAIAPFLSHECDDHSVPARAAIEAMREPTEAMKDAGVSTATPLALRLAWEAMIDAALTEVPA